MELITITLILTNLILSDFYIDNELDDHESGTFAPYLPSPLKDDPLQALHISGDKELQLLIRSLCEEFLDLLSNELPLTPASTPFFNLVADDSSWHHNKNRGPPRPQTTANQAEIVRQIATLEKQGIIEKSSAVYYSQVLMVTKLVLLDCASISDL